MQVNSFMPQLLESLLLVASALSVKGVFMLQAYSYNITSYILSVQVEFVLLPAEYD